MWCSQHRDSRGNRRNRGRVVTAAPRSDTGEVCQALFVQLATAFNNEVKVALRGLTRVCPCVDSRTCKLKTLRQSVFDVVEGVRLPNFLTELCKPASDQELTFFVV